MLTLSHPLNRFDSNYYAWSSHPEMDEMEEEEDETEPNSPTSVPQIPERFRNGAQ